VTIHKNVFLGTVMLCRLLLKIHHLGGCAKKTPPKNASLGSVGLSNMLSKWFSSKKRKEKEAYGHMPSRHCHT
jgi:hypothetical protein